MVGKKRWLFKRLRKESWKWKHLWSAFKWKRLSTMPVSFMDHVAFKLVSVFEAIWLVLTACLFYLCCGCHF